MCACLLLPVNYRMKSIPEYYNKRIMIILKVLLMLAGVGFSNEPGNNPPRLIANEGGGERKKDRVTTSGCRINEFF